MGGAGGRPRYITPEGRAALEAELKRLWTVERPKVTREVAEAAAQGDRSENAEYIYGKRRLREIDRRLRELSKRFETLEVVDPRTSSDDGRVRFGAWVTLEDETGRVVRYRLVGVDETRPEAGLVSIESPIGRVLLGKSEGDEVVVQRPIGPITYEVLKVEY
jgi:transcription elongation factor GreB